MDKDNFIFTNEITPPPNHTESCFEYTRTNLWNNISAPEINCDFQLMHSDLQEIKQLISDIKNLLKDFFAQQSYD